MAETKRLTVPEAEQVLGLYFQVHDAGFVSLVDYAGGDLGVERAARVSYGAGTRSTSKTRDLLRYLRRHAHTSPTEMAEVTFHMAMPIFVARQLVRTRTASLNEYSGRYSLMRMAFYTPRPEHLQRQSKSNKQGRAAELVDPEDALHAVAGWWRSRDMAVELYGQLTEAELSRELARIDLPLSTYTQWYFKIDLHNLFRMLALRVDPHAQFETRAYAEVMAGLARRVAPLSYEAWVDYDVAGTRLGRAELDALRVALANGIGPMQAADDVGLAGRERSEFLAKLAPRDPPDFRVDPAQGLSGEHFRELYDRLDREARERVGAPVEEEPAEAATLLAASRRVRRRSRVDFFDTYVSMARLVSSAVASPRRRTNDGAIPSGMCDGRRRNRG